LKVQKGRTENLEAQGKRTKIPENDHPVNRKEKLEPSAMEDLRNR
jgi:hypothetical protein